MRNEKSHIEAIYSLVKTLPAFSLEDISPIEHDKIYLKIMFGRYAKKGKLIRLKKGLYTTRAYLDNIEKTQRLEAYKKFLANWLYEPSYLSLEYVLFEYHLLTELPVQFTSISLRKTNSLDNALGRFRYHSIRKNLFTGFSKKTINGFTILQATKAKALFDFLYLRQTVLFDKSAVAALRLNIDLLTKIDKKEFFRWIERGQSRRLHDIAQTLINH